MGECHIQYKDLPIAGCTQRLNKMPPKKKTNIKPLSVAKIKELNQLIESMFPCCPKEKKGIQTCLIQCALTRDQIKG